MTPVAHFHSPFTSKFGIPRQSGLVQELEGEIIFVPEWRNPDTLRGLEDFDYIWLLWSFSANKHQSTSPTVRPPLLGGNVRMGVFATRSPYRPNPIGLSSVRITHIEWNTPKGPIIHVQGADLMDGTPILDIKPYLPFSDSHPKAKAGFTAEHEWKKLEVVFSNEAKQKLTTEEQQTLTNILELDPRPHYQHINGKEYGMPFAGKEIHFQVQGTTLFVENVELQ